MSLGHFLPEEGLELELNVGLDDAISFLDGALPRFDFGVYDYRLEPVNGVLGDQWNLMVKAWDSTTTGELPTAVALIQVGRLYDGGTRLKVLPREQWQGDGPATVDDDGQGFSRFAFQLLNALHGEGLIELPGPLPIE